MSGEQAAAAYRLNAATCVEIAQRSSELETKLALLKMERCAISTNVAAFSLYAAAACSPLITEPRMLLDANRPQASLSGLSSGRR